MQVKSQRFMAGQSMKRWMIVALDKNGYVILASPEHHIPIGMLNEDCCMGQIVEVIIFA